MSDPVQIESAATPVAKPPVVVKKYANRRLYNTESSSYVTLDSLAAMVRVGRDFVVYDAKSGDDITRSVLTQIIVEEESKGRALLPTGFLRQLIGFYGNSMQGLVPKYLENALESFERQQLQMRASITSTVGNLFPGMEEMSRQNMAMMERAMSLFSPFYPTADAMLGMAGAKDAAKTDPSHAGASGAHEFSEIEQEMSTLRAEVEPMRTHLDALSRELIFAREKAARADELEAEVAKLRQELAAASAASAPAPEVLPAVTSGPAAVPEAMSSPVTEFKPRRVAPAKR